MSTQPTARISRAEYLSLERKSKEKHEFFRGETFAMGGASRQHNLIVLNVGSELRWRLKDKKCEVYVSDMRVKVSRTGLYTYPDITVVCGEIAFDDDQHDTLVNPQIIFEVLSKATESCDRGKKFEHYRTLDSLTEYVLISQDEPHVGQFVRQPDGRWLLSETSELRSALQLNSINCQLPLTEIYARVEFATPDVDG